MGTTYSTGRDIIFLCQRDDLVIRQQRRRPFALPRLAQRRISSQDDLSFTTETVERHLRQVRVAFNLIDRWDDLGFVEEG